MARNHQIAHGNLHNFLVLVQRRCAQFDKPLLWTRFRRPNLQHFTFHTQLITRPNRTWPAQFIKTCTDDATSRLELAIHKQPHRDSSSMPTTRSQPPEYRSARSAFLKVKCLRIELGGKGLEPSLLNADSRITAESLARHKVVKVIGDHGQAPPADGSDVRICVRQASRISSARGESSGQDRDKTSAPTKWANRSIAFARASA